MSVTHIYYTLKYEYICSLGVNVYTYVEALGRKHVLAEPLHQGQVSRRPCPSHSIYVTLLQILHFTCIHCIHCIYI